MDDIDELPLPAKLEKLLRMVVMGRTDAAIKLAEVLAALLAPAETVKPKKVK
jgi:hypothetical protein